MAEKTVFLTSWLGGCIKVEGKRHPSVLAEANGLLNRIREYWKPESRVLMLCASPDDHEKNDDVFSCFRRSSLADGIMLLKGRCSNHGRTDGSNKSPNQ